MIRLGLNIVLMIQRAARIEGERRRRERTDGNRGASLCGKTYIVHSRDRQWLDRSLCMRFDQKCVLGQFTTRAMAGRLAGNEEITRFMNTTRPG